MGSILGGETGIKIYRPYEIIKMQGHCGLMEGNQCNMHSKTHFGMCAELFTDYSIADQIVTFSSVISARAMH